MSFSQEKSSFVPVKPCQKFSSFKPESDTENAVAYVSLRKKGCPSKNALHFCSKNLCRNDSTKIKDGPSSFRVLKLKKSPQIQVNGWNLLNPKYDLGLFHQSYKELVTDDGQEEMLQKHFIMNEDKVRQDFKLRITNLANYYHDVNIECNFSTLPKNLLFRKLKENKQKNSEERMKKKHYFLKNDIKFFNLGEEAYQETVKQTPKSLISQLNLFSLNELEKEGFNLKEETSDQEEEGERDELHPLKKDKTLPKLEKKTGIYEPPTRRLGKFLSPENMDRLKKKSTIFYNLEMQTSFLNKITNMENFSDLKFKNAAESRLMKMPKNSKMLCSTSSDNFNTQQLSGLNFDSKKFLEEEFNKSKYLTINSSNNQSIGRRMSVLSPEVRNKLKKNNSSNKRGSTFLSNLDMNEMIDDNNDFNNTMNKIIEKNIDFWDDFSKTKKNIDSKRLDEIIETRKNLKKKYLGKMFLLPEKLQNAKKKFIDLGDNGSPSHSTTIPSKFHSLFHN